MLRFSSENNLILRTKEKQFSLSFFKALLLALAIHMLLFLFLDIPAPFDPNTLPILSSTIVTVDLGTPMPKVERNRLWLLYPPKNGEAPPLLSTAPPFSFDDDTFFWCEPDFAEIEKIELDE